MKLKTSFQFICLVQVLEDRQVMVLVQKALVWFTVTESKFPHLWQPSQYAGEGGAMFLDNHAGGWEGAWDGEDIKPGGGHQDWGEGG